MGLVRDKRRAMKPTDLALRAEEVLYRNDMDVWTRAALDLYANRSAPTTSPGPLPSHWTGSCKMAPRRHPRGAPKEKSPGIAGAL